MVSQRARVADTGAAELQHDAGRRGDCRVDTKINRIPERGFVQHVLVRLWPKKNPPVWRVADVLSVSLTQDTNTPAPRCAHEQAFVSGNA